MLNPDLEHHIAASAVGFGSAHALNSGPGWTRVWPRWTHFFADQISDANKELALASVELDKLIDFTFPEIDGVLGTIEKSDSFFKRKSMEFKKPL